MTKTPHLRKVPTQARSRRRLAAILDAAAELFADQGFDATTMDAIATRAETSVGSVYQFFPNKLAVFHGVADRCNAAVRSAYTALVGSRPTERPIGELIDVVVDGFFALLRADQSFRAVWTNMQLYGELEADDLELERDLIANTISVLDAYAPGLDRSRRDAAARLLVQTISAGLLLALRNPPDAELDRELIDELKRMLKAYAGALATAD